MTIRQVPYAPTETLESLFMTTDNEGLLDAIEEELDRRSFFQDEIPHDTPSLEMPSYSL